MLIYIYILFFSANGQRIFATNKYCAIFILTKYDLNVTCSKDGTVPRTQNHESEKLTQVVDIPLSGYITCEGLKRNKLYQNLFLYTCFFWGECWGKVLVQ